MLDVLVSLVENSLILIPKAMMMENFTGNKTTRDRGLESIHLVIDLSLEVILPANPMWSVVVVNWCVGKG